MSVSPEAIATAVSRMGVLSYFPADRAARYEIMRLLQRMVASEAHLEWLVTTLIDSVGKWEGPRELRGLFCTRYRPADGIEASCSLSGFTAADFEARGLLEHEERKQLGAGAGAALVRTAGRAL